MTSTSAQVSPPSVVWDVVPLPLVHPVDSAAFVARDAAERDRQQRVLKLIAAWHRF